MYSEVITVSFGEKLRAARETKGYTQQQVADYMQIDKSTYCGYETGKRQPDVQKIKQLTKILGISGDDLLETGHATIAPTENGERDILDDVDVAFYGDFKELNEDEKETVRDMVRLMRQRKEKRSR